MGRCILVQTRVSEDKDTKDQLLWLTLCKLPSVMKNGGLFYPKSTELFSYACISKTKHPMDFDALSDKLPGSLFDVTYGYNEFSGKSFVARVDYVANSNVHVTDDLYK